jgi:hypothetical protein
MPYVWRMRALPFMVPLPVHAFDLCATQHVVRPSLVRERVRHNESAAARSAVYASYPMHRIWDCAPTVSHPMRLRQNSHKIHTTSIPVMLHNTTRPLRTLVRTCCLKGLAGCPQTSCQTVGDGVGVERIHAIFTESSRNLREKFTKGWWGRDGTGPLEHWTQFFTAC